ncbi:serine hydrolase [Streptomyces sp. WAC06614]|uniref:serine hydrolase domain-containing protein n=1 Tax=Streptomyces sp. WAC06614 TaxID=2487416 RepID=UPI000F788AF7|nr:serine hydrolase domain-containing protein [Streptomyces sp. WAC06614]RSS64838.1 class A beta-lactamase-related serine hydrolase [Streptomyces sp. WAC06614]
MRQRKTRLSISTALVASTAIIAGLLAASSASATDRPEGALRQAADSIHDAGAVGVVLGLHDVRGSQEATSGVSNLTTEAPVQPDSRFRAGSLTKTFIATVILQLTEETDAQGRPLLGLDEPVVSVLPHLFPKDSVQLAAKKTITVRQLLQHTSGLDDAEGATQGLVPPPGSSPSQIKKFLATPPDTDRLIAGPLKGKLAFLPGSKDSRGRPNMLYSNTGYDIAGKLIEAVTGHSWSHEVSTRIIDKLGLHDTSIPDPGARRTLPGPHAQGYEVIPGMDRPLDVTDLDRRTWVGAGGQIASTTADIDAFYAALLTPGRLLGAQQIEEMQSTVPETAGEPGAGYGLGLEHVPLTCDAGKPANARGYWGHTGRVLGYQTLTGTTPDGRSVTLSINGVRPVRNADGTIDQDKSRQRFQNTVNAATKAIDQTLCGEQ